MPPSPPPILTSERVIFTKKSVSKKHIFDLLTKALVNGQSDVNAHEIFDALIKREKLGNTSIGNSIAIPRAHLNITNPRAALIILKKSLDTIDTVDNKGVHLFLSLLIPDTHKEKYAEVLSNLNQILAKDNKVDTLSASKNIDSLVNYINSLLTVELTQENNQ